MVTISLILETEYPLAADSNDHLYPLGTLNDNYSNTAFLEEIAPLLAPGRYLRLLDLGCAGGALVHDCIKMGHLAVGLEGSDINARLGRAEWPHCKTLRTCDISREFRFLQVNEKGEKEPYYFDLITAWEVVEHIYPDRLTQFFENVRRHLRLGGQFLAGICGAHSEVEGHVYHHSIFSEEQWKGEILNKLEGLKLCDYPIENKVHYASNSMYIMLERVS